MWISQINPAAGAAALLILLALAVVAVVVLLRRKRTAGSGLSEQAQCAILMAVLCEELRADPADIRIKSIRKL
ncbi:MAG: hypothetical protein ACI4OI_00755 [Gemmiger sp.]